MTRLEQLNNTYIREPAYRILVEIDKLPYFLSKEEERREVNRNTLPAGWNENPRILLDNSSYEQQHRYLVSMVKKELARDPRNKGNRWHHGQVLCKEIDELFLRKKGEYVELQNDGNLVMYATGDKPVWSNGTDGQTSNMLIHLDKDVPCEQCLGRTEYLLSAAGKYKLMLDESGYLALSDAKSGVKIWEPETKGKAARELRMQADGNLVLYAACHMDPVCASDTHNSGRGCRAVLEDWGDLVVYDKEGKKRLWSSDDTVTESQINSARTAGPFG